MKSEAATHGPKEPSSTARAKALTDTGNAERLVHVYGDDLRFCHAWGKWLYWDGRRWKLDDSGRPMRLSKAIARRIRIEAKAASDPDVAEYITKWALSSESRGKREAMVDLAKCEDGIPIHHEELDLNPWLLNCMNGTLDLRKGKLRPHSRDDKLTKLVPFEYDRSATCPQWLAFLERIIPDAEVRAFLQRAVGWSLTADVSAQVFFFCYGLGANGKSTFLGVLQKMLGTDFAIQAAPELLLARRERGHPTDMADLFRVRLAVCTEIGPGRSLDEVTVKQLTGGDRVRARRMREDFWEFTPTHHIWIAANHKPVVHGTDEAIWRRILLVPFEVTIPEPERDLEMPDKLIKEIPGILAWAVEGCQQWRKKGLQPPDAVRLATKAYQDEMDVVGGFLEECCTQRKGASAPASALFTAYQKWATDIGEEPIKQKAFGLRLTERGYRRSKKRGIYHYQDIELTVPPASPSPGDAGDDGGRSGPSAPMSPVGGQTGSDARSSSGSSPATAATTESAVPRGDDGRPSGHSPGICEGNAVRDPGGMRTSSPIVPPDPGLAAGNIGERASTAASFARAHRRAPRDDIDSGDVCCAAGGGGPLL